MTYQLSREYQKGEVFCTTVCLPPLLKIGDRLDFQHEGHTYWGEVIGDEITMYSHSMDVTVQVRDKFEDQLVESYGEQYRWLIQDSLRWLKKHESKWRLDNPMDRAAFIYELLLKKGYTMTTEFAQMPWAGVGTDVAFCTLDRAIIKAGLHFEVEKTQSYVIRHDAGAASCCFDDFTAVKNEYFIRRTCTGQVFGRCGKDYTPLQNMKVFDFFRPFLDDGSAVLHTVGSFNGGQKVWVLAELTGPEIYVAGIDIVKKFILLVNSHDAKGSVIVGFTPIRFCCTNMLAALMHDKKSQMFKIRHHQGIEQAVEEMRAAMKQADVGFQVVAEQFNTLAKYRFPDEGILDNYIKEVFEMKYPKGKDELSPQMQKKLETIRDMAYYGDGNSRVNVKGTWWAAYNGVTQYLNYEAGRKTDTRLQSLWLGKGAKISSRALTIALAWCEAHAA